MGKVRIVTDSSAQFVNPELVKRYNIEVVPQTVRLGPKSFKEGVDLDAESFFRLGSQLAAPFEIVAPEVEAFASLYARLNRDTDQILSLHMSRTLGPTWDNARRAARTLLGRCDIMVQIGRAHV